MVYAFSIVSPRSSPSWLLGNAWSGVCCGYCRSSYRVSMLFLARLSSEDTETSKTSKWVANSSTRGQNPNGFLPAEDVDYLIKLSLGSVAGAAAIKYGSVVLPGFTRPNLVEAFSIIGLPVIIAVALLAAASLQKRDNNKP